jgi:hypothetical protein
MILFGAGSFGMEITEEFLLRRIDDSLLRWLVWHPLVLENSARRWYLEDLLAAEANKEASARTNRQFK